MMIKNDRRVVLIISAVFTVLLVMTWLVSDLAVGRVGPDITAAGRSFFSLLGICLLATRSRGALRRSVSMIKKRPGALAISGLLGVALYALSSLQAIALVGISLPNLLLATTPCVSMIIGIRVFGKTGSWPAYLGVGLAAAGSAVYVLSSFRLNGEVSGTTLATALGCGLLAVLAIAFYGQHYAALSAGHDPLDLLPGIFGFGTAILLGLLLITGRLGALADLDLLGLGLLALLGLIIYVPVYVLQHQLIHLRGAVFMASLSLAVPFGVRAVDVLLLDGPPLTLWTAAGMIICIGGIALVVRHPLQARQD